jgi:hypothetical protein
MRNNISDWGVVRGARALLVAGLATALLSVGAQAQDAGDPEDEDTQIRIVQLPVMNSATGMRLFASKGCVACHIINGVGGKRGPALDAKESAQIVSPMQVAARMWRGAEAMIEMQEAGFGKSIEFTGAELGHLFAFIADAKRQKGFSEALVPVRTRRMIKELDKNLPEN